MKVTAVPGQLAESKTGRDSGRFYLVLEVIGDHYVLVADGFVRRQHNPKKKNVKHLMLHPPVANELIEKLKAGRRITNAEICQTIEELVRQAAG